LFASRNIITIINLSRIRWAEHVARMGTTKRNLIRKYVGNNLEKLVGWENKIRVDSAEKIVALSCSGHDPLCRGVRVWEDGL